jgi:hypothetical protein
MDIRYTTAAGMNETIEGAVISHIEIGDRGATAFLMDGRALVFTDCECYAVVFSKDILQ